MPMPTQLDHPEDLKELRRYRIAGLIFMAVLIAAFPIYGAFEPARQEAARAEFRAENIHLGRGLYAEHCESCHGEEGRGGGVGPTLATQQFLNSVTNRQMHWLIAAGSPGTRMPAYDFTFGGSLTTQELDRVVVFLRSLEGSVASVPCWRSGVQIPAYVATDEDGESTPMLFDPCEPRHSYGVVSEDNAMEIYQWECADCHGEVGEGTDIGGPLLPLPSPLDEDLAALQRIIRDGVDDAEMPGFGLEGEGLFADAEIEVLARWFQSRGWQQAFVEQVE